VDIYGQRINSMGETQWVENGIIISNAPGSQIFPIARSDRAGGVIVAWHDMRNDIDLSGISYFDIYAQRVHKSGILGPPGLTITVNTNDDEDDGVCDDIHCSLRETINYANSYSGTEKDSISFNIPGSGPHTIQFLSPLPTVTDPVIIDATTQPGYVDEPMINLSSPWTTIINGLVITAGNSTVRGLEIQAAGDGIRLQGNGNNVIEKNVIHCWYDGISIENSPNNLIGGRFGETGNTIYNNAEGIYITGSGANGNKIVGNIVGTDGNIFPTGNNHNGIYIINAGGNIIGGNQAQEMNLISGNGESGIFIYGPESIGNEIRGNYIGTDVSGIADLGNSRHGVQISGGASNSTIGGTVPEARNVISGNAIFGVSINSPGTTGNLVQGNYIGTDVNGTAALGNLDGVWLGGGAADNTIGGVTPGASNVISGNTLFGVSINNSGTTGNLVQGNYIGTDASGGTALPNNAGGVVVTLDASDNSIGGTDSGAGNMIAFNGGPGVKAHPDAGTGNAILANAIHSNAGLGIDLSDDGVTPNDLLDSDTGPNNLQNFPLITPVVPDANLTNIFGTINSSPNTLLSLQFFSNNTCDPSGYGEGAKFLGEMQLTTDANGDESFSKNIFEEVLLGTYITATATGPDGTSEFCACKPVRILFPPVVVVIIPGERAFFGRSIPHFMSSARFHSSWTGSDVVMTLTTPSGRVIDTTDPDVEHENGPTFETYIITDPESGDWTIELFGADVPQGGEEVTVIVSGEPTEPTLVTVIDIKPGSNENPINIKTKNGVIPVAILTTPEFDALSVDHTSVTFGKTGVEAMETHKKKKIGELKRHEEDVDGDGDTDLMFHFRVGEAGLESGDTQAFLFGETLEGLAILGTDFIQTVGKPKTGQTLATSESILPAIPDKFLLEEAYPNPFNPVTHIRYGLPTLSNVKIEIYDMLGRKVSTLIDGQKPAGFHTVNFDGSNLSSGVYLYRIQAGEFIDTKKMILMK
jgi:CSLREA domain-containing protein